MERNITITLEKAKEWYNSGNTSLKEVALQAFNENELKSNFRDITSFSKACDALGINCNTIAIILNRMIKFSRASAAMFKLNIIRKALNLGQDLHLTKNPENSHIYYPYNPFTIENSIYYEGDVNSGIMEVIGKIKTDGIIYNVFGGCSGRYGWCGFGNFRPYDNVGFADASGGFLGCASKEIAQHFGKYFGMLITEAKYGDLPDFEIIDKKEE